MAWPENLARVQCRGFQRIILPAIKKAIDNKEVVWIPGTQTLFVELATGRFNFAGCVWEIEEWSEIVQQVSLIKGQPDTEDLTFAVLRG